MTTDFKKIECPFLGIWVQYPGGVRAISNMDEVKKLHAFLAAYIDIAPALQALQEDEKVKEEQDASKVD